MANTGMIGGGRFSKAERIQNAADRRHNTKRQADQNEHCHPYIRRISLRQAFCCSLSNIERRG